MVFLAKYVFCGDGVFKGYLNRPDLNKEKLVLSPYSKHGLMYRSADSAILNSSNELEYIGRIDNQVKIRGFRVELGEIEEKILNFPKITSCIVTTKKGNSMHDLLCAYYQSSEAIDISKLRVLLHKDLPSYMIPQYFIKVKEWPYNHNGKIDIKALPTPEIITQNKETILPRNEIDEKLIDILKALLNVNLISLDDNFSELGGDSLSAISLCAQIQNIFNCKIYVKDILERQKIQEISDLISKKNINANYKTIPHVEKKDFYPVSSAQKRMYFASSIAGKNSVLYNIAGGVILEGELDIKHLEECIKKIILRHEALRTYFEVIDSQVVQKILDGTHYKLEVLDNKDFNEIDILFKSFVKPFNLSIAPLFRTKLIKFTNDTQALFIDMHHIISDGTSLTILIDELCKLYNGQTLPELKLTYKDFAAFENEELSSGKLENAENFWLSKFQDEIPKLNLPTKNVRPEIQSFEGKKVYSAISKDLVDKINVVAKSLSVTPYMVMLAAYYILLYKYTSSDDIVVGTPVIGRDLYDTYSLIGMFVNTLAIREQIDSTLTFKEFLNELKNNLLNSYKYQTYPFDELVNKLEIKRDTSRNPLFDTMFIYQNNGLKNIHFNNLKSKYYMPDTNISKFDLSLEIIPDENGAKISFEYSTKLFDEDFINGMLKHYLNILNTISENLSTKISNINILTDEEKNKVLNEFNNTKMDYENNKTIVQIFEEQANKTPEKAAVVFEEKTLTYKILNEKANSLAYYLKSKNIGKNDVVGILLNRSFETIISILAVLKAGGIYTLIDNTMPSSRINYILENCRAKLLICDCQTEFSINTINISSFDFSKNTKNISANGLPTDSFALIYTSGSTGNPKGVVLTNCGLVNLIENYYNKIMFNCQPKKILGNSSISFDMFIVELFSAILLGGCLYLLTEDEIKSPNKMAKKIEQNKINFIVTTPTKIELLLSNPETSNCLSKIDTLQLGGEVFTASLFKKLKDITNANIFNGYGPTEITACCSGKKITDADDITIGTPIPNMKIYILDKNFNPCPIGVPGEICICGIGLAKEYIENSKKTEETFVNFWLTNERIYKTGDIGFFKENGEICFIGRNDFQVKINGVRIELSEIEKNFYNISDIESCVVVADKTKTFLKAFFVAKNNLSIPSIRKKLNETLPYYMVPKYIEQLDSIPTTATGKINRKALDNLIPQEKNITIEYTKPETPLQQTFCNIWEGILGTKVGIDNDLFELGADSLTAIKFKTEALNEGIDVSYADIFKYKTIRNLTNSSQEGNEPTPLEDFNYDNINKILEKNKLQLNYTINTNKKNNVFLLGSNGFVGMHIINSFIKNDDGIIYCLMRDKNGKGALNRFLEVLHFYFGNTLDSYIGNRIIVLKGDVLNENFGLSQKNYKKIIENVSVIINTAANVKHFGDFDKFKQINIEAIKKTIDFCKTYSKRLIHISTLSVSGNMFLDDTISKDKPNKKIYFSEKDLFINQSLDNVYTRSKFEAEKYVLDNIANGNINGVVLRLGNITSRYLDGRFQINPESNAFTSRLKSFVLLGVIPQSLANKKIEFTPVDLCANAIITCLQNYNKDYNVLHIYNRKHIKIKAILDVLKDFNMPIKIVTDDYFAEYINKILSNKDKKQYVDGIANDLSVDKKLNFDTNIFIKSDFSVNYLLHCKFKWDKISKEYIIKFITYLRSINFFNN